jgi:hypothetical protein
MARTEDPVVLAERLVQARAALATKRGWSDVQEVEDCPAVRHRHSVAGWYQDGCRCPSTRKAWEAKRETDRRAARAYRERTGRPGTQTMASIDLRKADRLDAEAIALGHRLPRCSIHTRGLAVKLMRERQPSLTDRQVAWKLTNAGQGRMVSKRGAPPVYEDVSIRQVQRIQAALDFKKLGHPHRAGSRLDRSGRSG